MARQISLKNSQNSKLPTILFGIFACTFSETAFLEIAVCLTRTVLDCEQSLFSQSSLSSAGLDAIYRAVIQSFLTVCVQFRRYSESDSYSSGSIWSRGVSTPFTTHQIQAVSLLHSCHVDSCRSYLFAILVRQRARWIPREKLMCYEMEESIRIVIVPYQFATSLHHSVYLHPCAVVSHSLLQHLYQAQDTGHPSE